MEAVLNDVKKAMVARLMKVPCGIDLFLIAISLEDYNLAARVLLRQKDSVDPIEKRPLDHFPPSQIWDRTLLEPTLGLETNKDTNTIRLYSLASCQYRDFIKFPPRVAWALQRASTIWEHEVTDGKVSYTHLLGGVKGSVRQKAVAERFEKIMMPNRTCVSSEWI